MTAPTPHVFLTNSTEDQSKCILSWVETGWLKCCWQCCSWAQGRGIHLASPETFRMWLLYRWWMKALGIRMAIQCWETCSCCCSVGEHHPQLPRWAVHQDQNECPRASIPKILYGLPIICWGRRSLTCRFCSIYKPGLSLPKKVL